MEEHRLLGHLGHDNAGHVDQTLDIELQDLVTLLLGHVGEELWVGVRLADVVDEHTDSVEGVNDLAESLEVGLACCAKVKLVRLDLDVLGLFFVRAD